VRSCPTRRAISSRTGRTPSRGRPGGRFGVSDLLAEDHLTQAERLARGRQVGAIAGALSFTEYREGMSRAGFTAVHINPTHRVTDGLHSAIIQAVKPRSTAAV
jgi:hypothetical protein